MLFVALSDIDILSSDAIANPNVIKDQRPNVFRRMVMSVTGRG